MDTFHLRTAEKRPGSTNDTTHCHHSAAYGENVHEHMIHPRGFTALPSDVLATDLDIVMFTQKSMLKLCVWLIDFVFQTTYTNQ